MTSDQEKQLLQSLYDRIFQAITYAPDGKEGVFDPSTTVIQLSKNEAISPADFKNQLTPMNPNGDFNAAFQFSDMADTVPALKPTYEPSTKKVSTTYRDIVRGANTDAQVDPTQKATYDANYNYLNQVTSIPNPPPQPPTETPGPTPIAQTYDENQAAYVTAVTGYRTAMNGYDLTKTKDQRDWNTVAPGLQLNIDKAWNAWVRGGKANIERAQNALVATINDIVTDIIADSQKAVADDRWLTSGANKFLLSYPLPGDWDKGSGSKGATNFTLSSSTLNTSSDSNFNSYGGGGSFSSGLWSVGGGFKHTDGQTNYHMDANNVEISAKLTLVRIMRPWLNTVLFDTQGWWLKGQDMNKISNGKLTGNSDGMLPLIPTAFVVMSDVTIKADFSAQDQSHIESATSANVSVGWGPFSISGNYSHSESHDRFNATYDAGMIKIPGMQVVAWVNEIVHACPPMKEPTPTQVAAAK
jgi:hypothetical protein